jgi:hypothetical protein
MFKLGGMVNDTATGLLGMLTHYQIEMSHARWYRFQPRGLNPEDGSPVKGIWIASERIDGGEVVPEPDMPLQALRTQVEDIATGFKGTAVAMILHMSGCVHVSIQPKGALKNTGGPVEPHDFDIRRVKGPALKPMSDEEVEKEQARKPSPIETARYQPGSPE